MSLLIMHGVGLQDVCMHDVGVCSVSSEHGADVFGVGLHKNTVSSAVGKGDMMPL
jgi:hypothetical protein